MKNNMKKIIIAVLMLVCTFTLVSCGKADKYDYPEKTPMVSNATDKFVSYKGWNVTNEQAYIKLLSSYGHEEILKWMDEILYTELSGNIEGFTDYLNEQVYGTKDVTELSVKEKKILDDQWADSMAAKGFTTEEEWTQHYKLLYLRQLTAKDVLKTNIANFEKLVNILNNIDFPALVTENQTLKTTDELSKDLKIEWSSDSEYVKIEDGTAKVTRGKFDVLVTLTAKITLDKDSTSATYKFTVPSRDTKDVSTTDKAEKKVNGYFLDEDYENYLKNNYQGSVKTVLVFFDSDSEARRMLKAEGIDVNTLNAQAWKNAEGTVLTEEQVKTVFLNLYNQTNGTKLTNIVDASKEYTYDELAKFNSTICKGVYDLQALNSLEEGKTYHNAYTLLPQVYNTKFFLALNLEKDQLPELDSKKAEIKEELISDKVNPAYVNYVMFDNILSKGTVSIYAEGLENKFVSSMTQAYTTAGQKVPEYKRTEGVSSTTVVSYNVNGNNHELTADQLFARLANRYGAQLIVAYLNQYVVLTNSTIYNFLDNKVLNEKKYKKLYEEVVKAAKDKFEKGEFASEGFPKGYGWDNFLRDRNGYTSEIELLLESAGAIYTEALGNYKKAITEGRHEEILSDAKALFEDYFKATNFAISAFTDADNDTNPDRLIPDFIDDEDAIDYYSLTTAEFWAKHSAKYEGYGKTQADIENGKANMNAMMASQTTFVNYLNDIIAASFGKKEVADIVNSALFNEYSEDDKAILTAELNSMIDGINQDNESTAEKFDALKLYYTIAGLDSKAFAQFKLQNLDIMISTSSSHTTTSNINDLYKEQLKAVYDKLINYQAKYEGYTTGTDNKEHKSYVYGTDLTGKDLDPYYSYNKVSEVTGKDTNYVVGPMCSDTFFNVDRVSMVYVTSISDRAKISKNVATKIAEDGSDELDSNGNPIKYVKYEAMEFLTEENYKKYLLDSDEDDNTSSGFTSSQKAVFTNYYVAAIEKMQEAASDKIINTQIDMLNSSDLTLQFATLKDKVINILKDNLSK